MHKALSKELLPAMFDMVRAYVTKILKKSAKASIDETEFTDRENLALAVRREELTPCPRAGWLAWA